MVKLFLVLINWMDDIADEMWLRQFSDIGLKITDRVQPPRSTVGDYAFHVLDKVVEINRFTAELYFVILRYKR